MRCFAVLLLALGLGVSACMGSSSQRRAYPISSTRIPAPPGLYGTVLWLANGSWVTNYGPTSHSIQELGRLWQLQPDGADLHQLPLPIDKQGCREIVLHPLQAFPDGRLLFSEECIGSRQPGDPDGAQRLLLWDPRTDQVQPWRPSLLPRPASYFSLAPDLNQSIASRGSIIVSQLVWLDHHDDVQLDLGLARAIQPSWSPDGRWIAFFGSERLPLGLDPQSAGGPHDLWLMPADCLAQVESCAGRLQRLVKDVLSPGGQAQWSPNSRWLAYDSTRRGSDQGIWLLDLTSGMRYHVVAGAYCRPYWAPDGQRLVVTSLAEGPTAEELLTSKTAPYIVDVSPVVGRLVSR